MAKRKGNNHRADWWDKAKASQPVETTTTPVEQIRQRAEATHLDYPHSRAVSDVTILLAEWDALKAENERLRAALEAIASGINLVDKAEAMGIDTDKHQQPIQTILAIARTALEPK